MEQNSQKIIRRRLARIEGQIRGLAQMIEDDRECKDLLIQLSAVRAALDSVGSIVISNHVEELAETSALTTESRQEISSLIKTFLR
jgi:DNA-binding FrmR family transcriptional regulator